MDRKKIRKQKRQTFNIEELRREVIRIQGGRQK